MQHQKIVLVTGASSGLGKATANYLATKGYRVYGTARNPDQLKSQGDIKFLKMDVCDSNSILAGIGELISLEGRIDILINNAGVGITGPLEETPHEAVLSHLDTNFHGPLRVIRAVLPKMRDQGNGFILNITSVAGYMGLPYRGIYSAGKAALAIATEAYRMEVAPFGIRMSTLAPGDYATNIASGRYHSPVINGSPYESSYGRSLKLMDSHVDSGDDPNQVARKVYKILKSRRPNVHYSVGSPMQRFSIVLKRLLPDKLFERLLLNHYKL